jgi:hypothetical protein
MGILADLADLMPATVVIAPTTGRDDFGKPSYGAGVSYKGRVVYKNIKVASRVTGEDVVASGFIVLSGLPVLHIDDRVTLEDGTTPLMHAWDQIPDEDGPLYSKIYFSG